MYDTVADLIHYEGIEHNIFPAKYMKIISLSDEIKIINRREIIILKASFETELLDYKFIKFDNCNSFIFHIKAIASINYIEKDGPAYLMTVKKEWIYSDMIKVKDKTIEPLAIKEKVYNYNAFVSILDEESICISLQISLALGGI